MWIRLKDIQQVRRKRTARKFLHAAVFNSRTGGCGQIVYVAKNRCVAEGRRWSYTVHFNRKPGPQPRYDPYAVEEDVWIPVRSKEREGFLVWACD